jgi:hypothetical protein
LLRDELAPFPFLGSDILIEAYDEYGQGADEFERISHLYWFKRDCRHWFVPPYV